jgi:hypothetical protein
VILVLAPAGDPGAAALVAELGPARASALSCVDLAASRSCLCHPDVGASTLTVAGACVAVGDISAVVNVLPAVVPAELTCYDAEEREYQAAELHAWLAFLLSALRCPVVNRPSSLSLTGPVLNPLGWMHRARACGLPLAGMAVCSDDPTPATTVPESRRVTVTWVLGGTAARTAAERCTARLGRSCDLVHLRAWYVVDESGQARFAGARSLPDLACERTRAALVDALPA